MPTWLRQAHKCCPAGGSTTVDQPVCFCDPRGNHRTFLLTPCAWISSLSRAPRVSLLLQRNRSKSQAKHHVRQILSRGPAQERLLWEKKRCLSSDALTTKATQTEASAKLQNTRHEEIGVACLFWQPHRSLYSTFTEIEEDTQVSAGRARQLQGDNAWMSTSPSESRNGRFERERKGRTC